MHATHRIILLATLLVAATACGKDAPSGPAQVYTVRGLVKSVESDPPQLMVHHEAIPDFVNRKGEKKGMVSMEMPFPLGEGVDVSTIAPGDKVELTFDVDWKREGSPMRVTKATELPADVALDFTGSVGTDPVPAPAADEPATDDAPAGEQAEDTPATAPAGEPAADPAGHDHH